MVHLLSAESVEVLAQLAWSRALLAFDFDGTLAPIVTERDAARMRAPTAALFAKLCKLYPCAVISGRSRSDVSRRLGSASVKYVVGNHGLEPGAVSKRFERDVAKAAELLDATFCEWAGIEVEDKRYSLAVHYRNSRNKRAARAAIHEAVAALPVAMRIVPGKLVVNVLPEQAPNKGTALLALREAEKADTALYIGDDATDEDVFELDQPGRLITIRVGASASSAASYYLRNQREVDKLLTKLANHRERGRSV
jgi:trehalose 6-phosphate phosphatase